jgi:hypothetical protein
MLLPRLEPLRDHGVSDVRHRHERPPGSLTGDLDQVQRRVRDHRAVVREDEHASVLTERKSLDESRQRVQVEVHGKHTAQHTGGIDVR